jgi:hypothetical protein
MRLRLLVIPSFVENRQIVQNLKDEIRRKNAKWLVMGGNFVNR